MENYIPSKWEAKESWSSNAHTDKIDLKIKKITRGKEEHYIMIQEYLTIVLLSISPFMSVSVSLMY